MKSSSSFFGCEVPSALVALTLSLTLSAVRPGQAAEPETTVKAEVEKVAVAGELDGDRGRLVIQADLKNVGEGRTRAIYGAAIQHALNLSRDLLKHTFTLQVDILQGQAKEIVLVLAGDGEVRQVTGEGLEDWSVRQTARGRLLVLRLKDGGKGLTSFVGTINAETALKGIPTSIAALTLTTESPTLAHGYVRLTPDAGLGVRATNVTGLIPLEPRFLPEGLRPAEGKPAEGLQAFRFHGTAYTLPLEIALADPEAQQATWTDFNLAGRLTESEAAFTLTARIRVKDPKGGRLEVLRGGAALVEAAPMGGGRLRFGDGRFVAEFDGPGEFPVKLEFNAAVRATNGWNELDFGVAPSALLPVALRGLPADTQFRFLGAARPQPKGEDFTSHLPPDGRVQLAWKTGRPEAEGRLFYAAESLLQVAVSPGLLRQAALVDLRIMQGEMSRLVLTLRGEGEVTRVQGPEVLSWSIEPGPDGTRHLIVQFNQPQKAQGSLQIQIQQALGQFPLAVVPTRIHLEDATRFGGYVRIVNEGAVRLEVLEARGLSQISPEQYPQTDTTRALLPGQTTQAFAYRFSGADYQLRVQADNIFPELTVSEVLAYHLGETELTLDAEMEVDVREAPLRELLLRIPRGFVLARLNASGLSDYFVSDTADLPEAELRIVYGTPVSGRQVVQLRLERNAPWTGDRWELPRLEVAKAKSVRGHVGVSADAGFRLSLGGTTGLTDLATAFFPKKVAGIQAAFRLSDAAWAATLQVERLPQTVQVDAFHLFSVAEGIAYGSSLINYVVTGAPVSAFKLELSDEYFNPEFIGKNIRSWQKIAGGYQVQLHTPVAGTYNLLATYERPFKTQGEKLTFTGARPLEVQSEQGHTIVISSYQFLVNPVNVSASLSRLEPGEVPPEYRLLFDAPILAAYRYTARPFNLELELKPLAQSEMVSQVIDRAALTTRISEEGQVVTDIRYFVKNKGTPNLQVVLPEGVELWSVTVNGKAVVPVQDQRANLIPLPQHIDPNLVNDVQIKLASRTKHPHRLRLAAPEVAAPVLLVEWQLEPDAQRQLVYRGGTLTPAGGVIDTSGFAGLSRLFASSTGGEAAGRLAAAAALLLGALLLWRLTGRASARRLSLAHGLGGIFGTCGVMLAALLLVQMADLARNAAAVVPAGLSFLAPVQQPNTALTLDIANLSAGPSLWGQAWAAWPALAAVVLGLYALVTSRDWVRAIAAAGVWTLLFWATLRLHNGATAFFHLALAFVLVQLAWPALLRWWRMPQAPAGDGGAAATAAVCLTLGLGAGLISAPAPQAATPPEPPPPPIADSVLQEIRVEDDHVFGTAKIRWQASAGQALPLFHAPGVLTRVQAPADRFRVVQVERDGRRQHLLVADQAGAADIELDYQTRVSPRDADRGFVLPTEPGLVNRVTLTVSGLDVEVASPQAVAVRRDDPPGSTNTVARLVLAPSGEAWIAWKPRSRDTRREKAVFYAELHQLYVPGAGVVEGLHQVHIRPAQGELSELFFEIPAGSTITDVTAPVLQLWRFDPDTRRLRVTLSPAQSKPFALLIESQFATGPLPVTWTAGLVRVQGAAGQIGLVGLATGNEVQLDEVTAEGLAAINLEDFPGAVLEPLQHQVSGLTLRRAFRHAETPAPIRFKASAVEPDVRVETAQTLSLGEDRTLLVATLDVEVSRAGIFKLSFLLPAGLDVESISGAALSHWTELKTAEGRVVTLQLKGRTEGRQQFALTLAGPGVRATTAWPVPRLSLREASKQRGQLIVVPEQGLRLQVATREGLTQVDPLQAGARQKGVLAFRLLEGLWRLALDLEQVDAWIQVTSLQHVTATEAQLKVFANLQYDIENTGVRGFRVRLPAAAENVRFQGEEVADFLPRADTAAPDLKDWDIKLHRRVIGRRLLQVTYTLPLAAQASEAALHGVQVQDVNLQRGFLTLQAGGRLQIRVENPPAALQPTEWQVIPRDLQKDITAAAANFTFRLVEPDFRLTLRCDRHEAARVLPARVDAVGLTSVIADDGTMLTQVQMQLLPGDKRLLEVALPAKARFWFAFVNQSSVWPWNEKDRILIPLEQHSATGGVTTVEFFYTSPTGRARSRSLDLRLAGPQFDLPLENIRWRVFLSDKWRVTDVEGTLQHQLAPGAEARAVVMDLDTYIKNEAVLQQQKTRTAEQFLNFANGLLQQGDPQQARRAFQTAYGLSQHDDAFNEDARVQLHNLKMQQAIVGLNVRQAKVAGEADALAATPRALRDGEALNYTQQEAKQLIDRNRAEDNAAQLRLAERLIQQQEAAVASPAAIRATIPEQGRVLTFTRPLQVDSFADLRIDLEAVADRPAPLGLRLLVLGLVFVGVLLFIALARAGRAASTSPAAR